MNGQEKFDKLIRKYPHPVASFSARPHLTRRRFFNLAGTGVTVGWLASKLPASTVITTTYPGRGTMARYRTSATTG